MKTIKKYEGNKYRFRKNSIKKTKKKYDITYHYVLLNILRYKKYINEFKKVIKIDESNQEQFNKLLLKVMESTAKDFGIKDNKVYSSNKFNKKLVRTFKKRLKLEKKNQIEINLKVVKLYKMIDNKDYKDLRQIAIKKPNDFLKALYLYTICED